MFWAVTFHLGTYTFYVNDTYRAMNRQQSPMRRFQDGKMSKKAHETEEGP